MLSPETTEHVHDHIADDLVARYGDHISRDEIVRIIEEQRSELEPGNHHPEFCPDLVEHRVKGMLIERERQSA